jgi:hypothetical protein
MAQIYSDQEDQNQRELKHANQKDENARSPRSESELTEEEAAGLAAYPHTIGGFMDPKKKKAGAPEEPELFPGKGEGGITDENAIKQEARGSDTPRQELESDETDTVKRKRESIEEGSMDEERGHVA